MAARVASIVSMPKPKIVEKIIHGQRVQVKVYPTVEDPEGRKLRTKREKDAKPN